MSEELKIDNKRQDGIETLEGGLENYHNQEEEKEELELTVDEKRKLLREIGNKPKDITDEEINVLTEEENEEIKAFAKLKNTKQIYGFVHRKKTVTDDDVKDLTDDEIKEMTTKALVMSQHLTYNPKKNFGTAYKKKRQNRNKMTKASRRANR